MILPSATLLLQSDCVSSFSFIFSQLLSGKCHVHVDIHFFDSLGNCYNFIKFLLIFFLLFGLPCISIVLDALQSLFCAMIMKLE